VLLFTDWTLLRLFPPLRAMWAAIGTQAKVAITGQNAKRVLFGTINVRTAHRTVYIGRRVGTHDVQAFLLALRKAYRRAGTIWLLADRASGHTAAATLALTKELRIEFVWLPRQWPELRACLAGLGLKSQSSLTNAPPSDCGEWRFVCIGQRPPIGQSHRNRV